MDNHVLLAISRVLTQSLDTPAQSFEEFGFIFHALFVSDLVL